MSRLFQERSGVVVDAHGVVHLYDTWQTDQDESHQYTECGVFMSEYSSHGDWIQSVAPLTCLACVCGLRYERPGR